MGDAMAGSRLARAGTRRTAGRRRAVGTRDKIIAHLAAVAEIADPGGMASTKLAEAVGYPGSSVAFAQLLSGMERDGLITREVRGKRTYRITMSGTATARQERAGRTAPGGGGQPAANGTHSPAAAPAAGVHAGSMTGGADSLTEAALPGFDYEELARRLLIQVVRRLAASPTDLEQTVAALERELATAWTRHATLTAENVRLRQQLLQTQRDLDLARERGRKLAITDELGQAEADLLERLLAHGQDGDEQQPAPAAGRRT